MASVTRAFFAYPAADVELRSTIETGARSLNRRKVNLEIWPAMDTFGAYIPDEVRESIKRAKNVFCDVTIRNENVYYEMGFAAGLGKRVGPVVNSSFAGSVERIRREGLFDNIGYRQYENSKALRSLLEITPRNLLSQFSSRDINYKQPLFFLDTKRKTDFRNVLVSAIKRSKVFYRSFDPIETPRISAFHIMSEVSSSLGVIVPFLGTHIEDYQNHNLRAAFVAGLAHGLGRSALLIRLQSQQNDPADYRDSIVSAVDASDIEQLVREFSQQALLSAQDIEPAQGSATTSALRAISLGAVAAENEFRTLEQYFVETAEFGRTVRGEVKVVTGRKGSGKSAIFFRARDTFRRQKRTVVVDLKPESHQLLEFRQNLEKTIDTGVIDHTLVAFWHYMILSEVLIKVREDKSLVARNNQEEAKFAIKVEEALGRLKPLEAGDFTSRLNSLSKFIVRELEASGSKTGLKLNEITNILYSQAVPEIRSLILEGTQADDEIVILFDNIDKGWPSGGVEKLDTRVVQLLLEALNKAGQEFSSKGRNFQSTVFLRNDIFEILIGDTPDRGKAGRVNIDWTDREKLKQVILKRMQVSLGGGDVSFDVLWYSRFVGKIDGVDSFDFFINHSLMRPRFLIATIELALANAINRGHTSVLESDCKDAVKQNAYSLLDDFGYEIRDVSKLSEDLIYSLVGCPREVSSGEVIERLKGGGLDDEQAENAFHLMLWYGVVGLRSPTRGDVYIYDVDYNMKRLQAEIRRPDQPDRYVINPALHVALD